MKVRFDARAAEDLDGIFAWIAADSPQAAIALIDRIEARIGLLETPGLEEIGRRGVVEGTRELIEWPYIIVYRIEPERDEIVLLAVVHGARERDL